MYVGRPRPPTSYRHWREKRPPGVKVNADVCRAPEAPNFNVENWVVLSVEIWAFFYADVGTPTKASNATLKWGVRGRPRLSTVYRWAFFTPTADSR